MSRKYSPTDEQRAVIAHDQGHALVSAVAGAGKTTTIVERLARMVGAGMDPARIIAIQYNKSAQLTMQAKLRDRMAGLKAPEARTFHSIGYGMMKKLVDIGALKPAKLETSQGMLDRYMRNALRTAWKRSNGPNAFPSNEQMDGFQQFVTRVKADIRTPADVFREGDFSVDCAPYVHALQEMDSASEKANIVFFDDLLAKTYRTLEADPSLWVLFSDKVSELVIDEFQDVNPVQYAILQGIAGSRANVMAVGDADQSIYGWRGAEVDFINKHFARDFAPCTLLRLTNTFRYGHQTALIANHIISHNLERDDKITVAHPNNPKTRVTRVPAYPKRPSGLVPLLRQAVNDQSLLKQAMLVRYYSQSVPYEIELAEAKIPFHVYGREPLLLIPEIASLVAAMSLATDYWVVPEALRARFLGALLRSPTVFAQNQIVERGAQMMDDALADGATAASALFELAKLAATDTRVQERIRKRADVVRMLEAGGLAHQPPAKVISAYLALTDFKSTVDHSAATKSQAAEVEQNVAAFTELAGRYATTVELLDTLGPLAAHRSDKPPEHDHLGILSMHRAKGLEWDTVYLPGWSAGSFPRDHEDQEEERRLAYVAVTRAIHHLVFLHPQDDLLNDLEADLASMPAKGTKISLSPFLYDAETGLSAAASDAIAAGAQKTIRTRRADMVNRYMREAKQPLIDAEVPPEVVARMRQTDANPNLILQIGQKVRTTGNPPELYTVHSKIGDRFYYVKPDNPCDAMRLMCLDEPGWALG